MAQDWIDDVFGETHDGITDLENMEKNFTALKSFFSGSSEPTFTKVSGMPWYDTSQKILKIRNSVNNAWVGVMTGNENFKIWVYLNVITYQEGWGLDGSAADMVIGLKGSSRYTTGATVAGSWTLPNYSTFPAHAHTMQSHTHTFALGSAGSQKIGQEEFSVWDSGGITDGPSTANTSEVAAYTPTHTDSGTWGIRAAVGIMVYPDINP